jgi:hypothetical protein
LIALSVLDDVMSWYKNDRGNVAIFDGTNTTAQRRQLILERAEAEQPELQLRPIFIEIICNDRQVIDANVRAKIFSSPDYAKINPEKAILGMCQQQQQPKQQQPEQPEQPEQQQAYQTNRIANTGSTNWRILGLFGDTDFTQRIEHYKAAYETLGLKPEDDHPYIKIFDVRCDSTCRLILYVLLID